jgi:hypothetical protein
MQMPIWFDYLSVFVDVGEILVMADDVATPSNPPVAPMEQEELEEAPLDVNVFQWTCEKKSSRRVVCIRVNHSAWDHQLSPNPHALAIYLKFVPARGAAPERFEECQCEDDDVHFIVELEFLVMAIIVGYEAPLTPFPWSIEPNI